jgi:hypothetical protein
MESCKALLQEEKTLSDYNWKWATHYLLFGLSANMCYADLDVFVFENRSHISFTLYI